MNLTLSERIAASLHKLSPYVLTGLLVPGGLVIALLMWLYRRKHKEI